MAAAMAETGTKTKSETKKKNAERGRRQSYLLQGAVMALEDYRARVEALACARNGDPVFNGSLDHAEVIVEKMFSHARKDVSILTGKLNARVYGTNEVLEQARLFLADSDHRVCVLMEDNAPANLKDHPFIEEFRDYENVEFKYVPESVRGLYDFHFLVMDSDSYRFEEDKTKPAAIAAFGDVDGAKNIEHIFAQLWDLGEPLELPELES